MWPIRSQPKEMSRINTDQSGKNSISRFLLQREHSEGEEEDIETEEDENEQKPDQYQEEVDEDEDDSQPLVELGQDDEEDEEYAQEHNLEAEVGVEFDELTIIKADRPTHAEVYKSIQDKVDHNELANLSRLSVTSTI